MRPKGYWKDWYWNRGGRDKVQARRKITEYNRYKRKIDNGHQLLRTHHTF